MSRENVVDDGTTHYCAACEEQGQRIAALEGELAEAKEKLSTCEASLHLTEHGEGLCTADVDRLTEDKAALRNLVGEMLPRMIGPCHTCMHFRYGGNPCRCAEQENFDAILSRARAALAQGSSYSEIPDNSTSQMSDEDQTKSALDGR